MAISVLFLKKGACLRKVVFKKVWRLSRELWWTGSLVAVFENENQRKAAEIHGWFSIGDFVLY
jgi:predicted nucleotidyltransferase component of viral defense system